MEDQYVGVIGLIAGICTTVSFIPQIVKILKTRHAGDISLYMYLVLTTGILLWLIYGILLGKTPIIVANGTSFFLCLFIIMKRVEYGRRPGR